MPRVGQRNPFSDPLVEKNRVRHGNSTLKSRFSCPRFSWKKMIYGLTRRVMQGRAYQLRYPHK